MFIKKLLVVALLSLFSLTSFALKVGDKAVELNVKNWIKNGPVKLKDGLNKKIYVVEFWATWCPPCRSSIPHLSMLQKKYEKDGLVVVGISNENKKKVEEFVKKQTKMDYSVASDEKGKVYETYMKEYSGIPNSFLIDKKGMIVWVGHPMMLDSVISKVLKGEAIPKSDKEEAKVDFEKELEAIDKKIKAEPDNAKLHLTKLWLSFDINSSDKWLVAFKALDKNDKLKTAKELVGFYKAKDVIDNIKENKTAMALKELEKGLANEKFMFRRFLMVSVIYYNYIQTQKGEKNLLNDAMKKALSAALAKELKTVEDSPGITAYILNLKSYLEAGFKDYKEAIEIEQKAIKLIKEMKDDNVGKTILMKLIKKNMSDYEKNLKVKS